MIADPYPVPPFLHPVEGAVELPGSKSISNRALVLAALAEGETILTGMLFSRDTELMLQALTQLGIHTKVDHAAHQVIVRGCGGRIPEDEADLFIGNAGTAARFLTALICLHPKGCYRLDGDPPMRERPMSALINALSQLGARFEFEGEPGHFPFKIHTAGLKGGAVQMDARASSQFVSALLMVAPYGEQPLELEVRGMRPAFVDITIRMMQTFGAKLKPVEANHFYIHTGNYHSPSGVYAIEPDATAATYFVALPRVTGGTVFLPGLGPDMLQGDTAFVEVATQLGLRIVRAKEGWEISTVEGSTTEVHEDFSTFSDTFLTLAAIAPLLGGPTRIDGIAHTRAQETDRVAAMANELKKLGCKVIEKHASLEIHPDPVALRQAAESGVEIDTYEDHRIAMSFAILGCANLREDNQSWLKIRDPLCCKKTFPKFFEKLAALHAASHV